MKAPASPKAKPRKVYLGLGSNLGDRQAALAQAVVRLARSGQVEVGPRSSVFEAAPIGPEQPDFLNAAVEVSTRLDFLELLSLCQKIEVEMGRVPGVRWGPRFIDIDLLFSDEVVAEPQLQIPHLSLHLRAFALLPLCELAPRAVHPLLDVSLRQLLSELGNQRVRRLGPLAVDL